MIFVAAELTAMGEMPNTCKQCRLYIPKKGSYKGYAYCMALRYDPVCERPTKQRQDFCPLIETDEWPQRPEPIMAQGGEQHDSGYKIPL